MATNVARFINALEVDVDCGVVEAGVGVVVVGEGLVASAIEEVEVVGWAEFVEAGVEVGAEVEVEAEVEDDVESAGGIT